MLPQITVTSVKLSCDVQCAWEMQCALSENNCKARVDDGKLALKSLLRNFDKFNLNYIGFSNSFVTHQVETKKIHNCDGGLDSRF